MKYYIKTFGCQANLADAERIARKLETHGYKPGTKKNSEIIVLNACSVRKMAFDRVYGQVKNLHPVESLRSKDAKDVFHRVKNKKIILAGCILEADRKKLKNKVYEIWHPDEYFDLTPVYSNNLVANIPIMSGCNNFCTYCAVPYTRGREKSRPAKDIVKDVKTALKKGIKEIWLIGQNVNSYNSPIQANSKRINAKVNFAKLLKLINSIPGDFWIRFASPHPKDFSDGLILAMKECQKFPHYLNLPLQSGDNTILKKMNRPYTIGHYQKLIGKMRQAMPDIAISTDIIVGFPGETRKQFENTANAMRKIGFDMAYLSEYSPRSGTLAAQKMKDDVSAKEKARRKNILNGILAKSALKNNKKLLGKTVKVLNGRTKSNKPIKIIGNYSKNKFTEVKITRATPWNLEARLDSRKRSSKRGGENYEK